MNRHQQVNPERLRVTRFRKMKLQEVSPFIPIAKQMKAIAMPIQVAEPVECDGYYDDGYFWFPLFSINYSKRHWKHVVKLIARVFHVNKKTFKFKDYIFEGAIITCLLFPPIPISIPACLFANKLYKRSEVGTWYDGKWFRLHVV